jgi:hypothetical protein
MMQRIKQIGTGIGIAVLAFLAAMAAAKARQEKQRANEWAEQAEADAQADVVEGTDKAKAALSQAKLHEAKADEAKKAARARLDSIGERDEDVADVVHRWRKSNRMRNAADS